MSLSNYTQGRRRKRFISSLTLDVANAADVDRGFSTIETDYGRLDLLFNNAGTGSLPVPFEEISTVTASLVSTPEVVE